MEPQLGWTSTELEPLGPASLRMILSRDLRSVPVGASRAALRKQVLAEQENCITRGELRWIPWDIEDVLLYEPTAARSGRRIVKTLDAVNCWGDLRRLVEKSDPAADYALRYLWDLWDAGDGAEEFGFEEDSEIIDDISNISDLMDAITPQTPLALETRNDDSDSNFVDPLNPWQMGVPVLIIHRYCVERSNMVSNWTATSVEDLPFVRKTAHALGWSVRKGSEGDLDSLL